MTDNPVNFKDLQRRMEGALTSLKSELASLRTGRASASLLDSIMVDAYGAQMPITQVASVSVPEPRMIHVQVWDKSMVQSTDRAIRESSLGLNPIMDGQNLRIPMPELNEQRRKELAKIAGQYAEQGRVAARHVRRDGMDSVKKAEKDGDCSKDEAHKASDQIQKLTDETIAKIDLMIAEKEKEIMQV
ncbi:MAG: ribosome recycling factor [Rhizobiales bacterium]|nr:ribosome recycling factor [Hyphomicrobiales bacterium]